MTFPVDGLNTLPRRDDALASHLPPRRIGRSMTSLLEAVVVAALIGILLS
jgi:hypothetical protein